eukprot:TRINITY_DN66122_c9_g1_i2.p1 TRINITY_DN66122_c9_g1~~TRINITY_DN66122_c9_g1_i2.p1  ORF type:complete len:543 (+),score=52.26 TRINITY_DN66122_c9_g1_i2:73-1701(+)
MGDLSDTFNTPHTLVLLNSLAGLIFGYILIGVNSPAGNWWSILYNTANDNDNTDDNVWQNAAVTSIVTIGAGIGAVCGAPLINRLGRKKGIAIGAAFAAAANIGSGFSYTYAAQVIFRFVVGIGAGLTSQACPVYVQEMSDDQYRGSHNAVFQVMITAGIFVCNLVGYYIAEEDGQRGVSHHERKAHAFSQNMQLILPPTVLPLLLCVLALVMPESRKWVPRSARGANNYNNMNMNMVQQQQQGPSSSSSSSPNFDETQPLHPKTHTLLVDINNDDDDEETQNHPLHTTCGALVSKYRKASIIGLFMVVSLQLTGINSVMFYAPAVFSLVGLKKQQEATVLLMLWNFVTTFMGVFLVDKIGRRKLMLATLLIMSISITGLGIVGKTEKAFVLPPSSPAIPSSSPSSPPSPLLLGETAVRSANTVQTGLTLAFFALYIAAFETGPACVFWVIINEIYAPSIASSAAGLCNAEQWTGALVVTLTFLPLKRALDGAVFILYGVIGFVCWVFLLLCLPETKAKSLQEITREMNAKWIVIGRKPQWW